MNWQTLLVFVLLFISAVAALVMTFFAWQRRELPGARAFAMVTASLATWSLFYALEVWAQDITTIILWSKFQYVGIAYIPVGWFLFAMGFSGREQWWKPVWIAILSVIPVLTVISAFTNEWHGWHWSALTLNTDGPFVMLDATYGVGWWIYFVYAYVLLFVGSVALIIALWNFPAAYRWQLVLLILSPILPWVGNALYIARISPVPQLDLGPFAFTGSAIILGWGIFRFRLFDMVPVARSLVVDNMSIAMFVLDQHDRVVDANPAALVMINSEGSSINGLTADQVFGRWPETLAQFAGVFEITEEISVPVGDARQYLKVQISPIHTQTGKITGRLVMLSDITRDKLAEEALAMAQVRTEFLAKVGHELRTPIGGILGLVEMMEYGVYGSVTEQQGEVLRRIIGRTNYLTSLVNDLLDLTRLESGQFSLAMNAYQVADLIKQIQENFAAAFQEKSLVFSIEIAPDIPPMLCGDATRLYQILANLVDNAIKFTDQGSVKVRAFCPDDTHWAMEVADTGIGIPEPVQVHLFDAFRQANYSITREQDGVGLGLAIVKQLVTLMGGEVRLVSKEGEGAVFTVLLPLEIPTSERMEEAS